MIKNEDAIFESDEARYIAGVPFSIDALGIHSFHSSFHLLLLISHLFLFLQLINFFKIDVVDVSKCKVSGLEPDAQYLLCPTTFKIDAKNKDSEALITGMLFFSLFFKNE